MRLCFLINAKCARWRILLRVESKVNTRLIPDAKNHPALLIGSMRGLQKITIA